MRTIAWKPALVALTAAWLAFPTNASASAGRCSITQFKMPVTMDGMRASVPIKVNGKDTSFWLDSGAWFSTMSLAKAQELGLPLSAAPYGLEMEGIGGSFTPQVAKIKDFGVVGAELHNVDFIVGGSDTGNGLIGRNLLTQTDTEFDLAHGSVSIVRPKNCSKTPMAYWAPGKPYFTVKLLSDSDSGPIHDFRIPVRINGAQLTAEIDTGASTLISRRAAERAGIDLKAPGVKPISGIYGFGRHYVNGWIVPGNSVDIGDETVLHARLMVIDGPILDSPDAPDMLLGIGFVLAHHMYVSREQRLIYFTYSGGNPFPGDSEDDGTGESSSAKASARPALPAGTQLVTPIDAAAEPTTADGFARRASARLAKRDTAGAIADYTKAIGLAPRNADYYKQRADARQSAGDYKEARADFDKAIELAPGDPELLRERAWIRHGEHDDAGALADARAAQKLIPQGSLDLLPLALLFERLGQAAEAAPIYDTVIATHHDDAKLSSLLNGSCWSRGLANVDLDHALKDCNRAFKLTGKAAAVRDSRALVLFRQGKYREALEDYDTILKADPKQAWSLYMRGMTRTALGEADAGKADRDAALKLEPGVGERAKLYKLTP